MQIWPWEYHDSFEGECIEEVCKPAEITEFCSRRETSLTLSNEADNKKLTERRRSGLNNFIIIKFGLFVIKMSFLVSISVFEEKKFEKFFSKKV